MSSVLEVGRVKSDNRLLQILFNDFTFSGITQMQSGIPYSAQIGADLNRDGNSRNDRVPCLGETLSAPVPFSRPMRASRERFTSTSHETPVYP